MKTKSSLHRVVLLRLLPLYSAAFFQGFVLWYAIEKLFMRSIGFNDIGIGFMVAAYSAVMLFVETPSGILADRWSRKGVLVIASISLALSGVIGGFSTEPTLYILAALLWGVFFAFYSGTYDSLIYDTILEITGKSAEYEKYYGYVRFIDSIALVIGAILGGIFGQLIGLSAVYIWSAPFALLALICLWFYKEPQLHKAHALGSIKEHVIKTALLVFRRRTLVRLLIIVVLISLLQELLYEFSQLWLIALVLPPALFGPAFAVVLSALGLGGLLAGWFGKYRRVSVVTALSVLAISSLCLALVHSIIAIVIAQVAIGLSVVFLSILFMKDLHDSLPSDIRASASSTVSTLSRLILIPFALLFGAVSTHFGIFTAAWIMVGVSVYIILGTLFPQLLGETRK